MAPPSSILLLIILVISLHHLLQVNSQYNSSFERAILLRLNQHWGNNFYSPYNDESWTWNVSSSHCDWPTVFCADDTEVTGLFLSSQNISGTIPSSICQLQYLVSIDLSGNYISGPIPADLRDCSSLKALDLSRNQLSGTIPGELFLMKSLVILYLSRNRLQGIIPTTIEKAVSLERLDLSNNHNLNGSIPDGITHLHNLRYLDLSVNSFSGEIPTRMFILRRLQSLSLGYNNLSGQLPSYIGMRLLRSLNLTHNRLSGPVLKSFIRDINKTNSRYLDLSDNQLRGDIDYISHNLVWIARLNLCNNKFSGIVPYEFVNRRFEVICLDPSNLCSVKGATKSVSTCSFSLCSHRASFVLRHHLPIGHP